MGIQLEALTYVIEDGKQNKSIKDTKELIELVFSSTESLENSFFTVFQFLMKD
jgi:hypothetical protein